MSQHHHASTDYGRIFALGIGLNLLYIAVEVYYGLRVQSTALLADAGHNATDVVSLGLAWAASWAAQRKPSPRYTYGLRKTTILASLVNGILIVVAALFILREAIHKLQDPQPMSGRVMMIVAAVGIVINGGTALLFMKGQKSDLNIKGAFLHMLADAGVTLGVLLGGVAISYTDWVWIDPVLSFLIIIVILYGSWGLLRDSINLALDGVPRHIDLQEVRKFLQARNGVEEVHDLHVWALSTTETALTVHLVIPEGWSDDRLYRLRDELHERFDIGHTTVQIEQAFEDREYREHQV